MIEWILIFTLNIGTKQPGEIRDVSVTMVPGFTSRATCEVAAQALGERTVAVVGRARIERGIQGNAWASVPAINTECVQVRK
jgi:proline racemase